MKLKKLSQNNKAITLIALVVTIIVLLILAGISIIMLTGQNGILNRAKEAKEATRGGDVQDIVRMEIAHNTAADYTGGTKKSKEQVINELYQSGKITEEEKSELEKSDTITIGGTVIDFGPLGKSDSSDDSEAGGTTLVEAFQNGDIHVGDYITDYNEKLKDKTASISVGKEKTGVYEGKQRYDVDLTTTWRILGLDETKTKIVVTTGSPIKRTYTGTTDEPYGASKDHLYLSGPEGLYWAGMATTGNVLDEICGIYDSELAETTRSIRLEDINNALELVVDEANGKLYKKSDTSKTNPLSGLSGVFNGTHTYKSGEYAPENYLKEKYSSNTVFNSLTSKKIGDPVQLRKYSYNYTDSQIVDQSSKVYSVLFDNVKDNAKDYWLASYGYMEIDSEVYFGIGNVKYTSCGIGVALMNSIGDFFMMPRGVRPIAYLKPTVTIENLKITPNGSETPWTDPTDETITSGALEYGRITN